MRRSLLMVTLLGTLLAVALGQLAANPQNSHFANSASNTADVALVRNLEALANQHPDDAALRLKLAFGLIDLGETRQAQMWLDEAAAIDPALYDNVMGGFAQGVGVTLGEGGCGAGGEGGGGVAGGGYPVPGPDIIVGDLHNLTRWGRVGNITAYSVGTVSCNAGDTPVQWVANTNQHPVIAQHMYRYKGGRFEMIGQSWVKHGFLALTQSLCQSQFGYSCIPPGTGSLLGVGCSDPYGSNLNGSYTHLGPKHEINPTTGLFPYPFGSYPNNGPIGKRLQVHDDDLKPSLNAGALYYVEGHYIAADDAAAGNGLNNASYRRIAVTESSPFVFNISFVGGHPTVRELPAIYVWQTIDPDVVIQEIDVPDDGRFIVAHRVSDNNDGTWSYEYAVHNFNSDRSAGRFTLEVGSGINVTNVGFRSVPWHSGAPYSNAPWNSMHEGGQLEWATVPYVVNPNANALRWGTLYNFRFDADAPPVQGDGAIGLFKPASGPGGVDEVTFAAAVPEAPDPGTPGDLNGDGSVGVADLLILLAAWGPCNDCSPGACPADLNGDCNVGVADLLILLANWG